MLCRRGSLGERMNKNQKIVLAVVAIAIVLMLAFPPFYAETETRTFNEGYSFILDPPTRHSNVNIGLLLVQWVGVLILGGLAWILTGYTRTLFVENIIKEIKSKEPTPKAEQMPNYQAIKKLIKTTKSFAKTPLVYVYLLLATPIGEEIGIAMNPNSPEQAAKYVFLSVFVCGIVAAFVGYFISLGIDVAIEGIRGRVFFKICAGSIIFTLAITSIS